ncbi:MAG: HD-GYP domain-containing protein [Kiritimatiellia bacterium]
MSNVIIASPASGFTELLGYFPAEMNCEFTHATTGAQTLLLAAQIIPDLILLDASLPDMAGSEICRHLRLDPLHAEVPILLLFTATDSREARLAGLKAGADDVLGKPVDKQELVARIQNILHLNRYRKLIQLRSTSELARVEREISYESVLIGWARALELRGVEPEGHIQRVTRMTIRLAQALNVSAKDLAAIRLGVLLHDSGMCGVADNILKTNRSLSSKKRASLHKHPDYAYDMFCGTDAMRAAIEIPYCHHEHWDGNGYPRRLKGAEIPFAARLFAVADAWDILTAPPPCGKGWSKAFARHQIGEQAGKRFDLNVVRVFESILTPEDLAEPAESAKTTAMDARAAQIENRPDSWRNRLSMSSRGTKLHFFSALMLISVLPFLAFVYISICGFMDPQRVRGMVLPLAFIVVLLMALGYTILAKYPASVVRLRRWVEELAHGDMPVRIELSSDEDDLIAIERCLREVVRQSQQRVYTLEQRTEALLVAERQRVAIEGLGAACHHLGQPATSISITLDIIRQYNTAPEIAPLIDKCQKAANNMSEILHKLQHIAKYRTEPYLLSATAPPTSVHHADILQL